VINLFKAELSKDKTHTRMMGLTSLGFLEITRKKTRYGITDFFTTECNSCQGRGRVVNTFALCSEIKRKMAHMAYTENDIIVCEANTELLACLTASLEDVEFIKDKSRKNIEFLHNKELNPAEYKLYTK